MTVAKKWITTVEYVDHETGEILTENNFKTNYQLINEYQKFEENEKFKILKRVKSGEPSKQLKLF